MDAEKMVVLLEKLAEVIKDQDRTISIQQYQLESIKNKLNEVESIQKEKIEKR